MRSEVGHRLEKEPIRSRADGRLGIAPDEIDGGHTPALSRPKELVERLEAYAAEANVSSG
jgi:hypothetical protein